MIQLKVTRQLRRLGKKSGQYVYQATQGKVHTISYKSIEEEVVQKTALSRGDLRSAIITIAEVLHSELAQGRAVDLAELGVFRPQVASAQCDKPEQVTAKTIKAIRARYTPRGKLRERVKDSSIRIKNPFLKTSKPSELPD